MRQFTDMRRLRTSSVRSLRVLYPLCQPVALHASQLYACCSCVTCRLLLALLRRYGVVYFIFVLLGTGTLLPWNVFLTEKEFYDVRMHVVPFNPYITNNFMSIFCLVFNTA